ncbi:MAG TPA: hypothetical protein PLZ84_08625, partial [Clostridia bacterium]|nr:hypothetical protein [Clostridia bacterium]
MKKKAYLSALIILLAILPLVFMISGTDPAMVIKNSPSAMSSPIQSNSANPTMPGTTTPGAAYTDSPTPATQPLPTESPDTPQQTKTPDNTVKTAAPAPVNSKSSTPAYSPTTTVRTDESGMNHISDNPTQYPDDTATVLAPT